MQFTLVSALAFISVAAATVTPVRRTSAPPESKCNTGDLQCCNTTQNPNTNSAAELLSRLGIVAQGVTGLVGVTCTPITAIGVSGNSCTAQPVCCSNNSFNGLVALGCTPVNLNL